MRMEKIQQALEAKRIVYEYIEEDGCGSFDFQFRGLSYHIWEYTDNGQFGAETNVFNVGRSQDVDNDYDERIAKHILSWPDMLPGF